MSTDTEITDDMHNLRCVLVVPCYNEAARLDLFAFREFLANNSWLECLFVDDGSTDTTWKLLEAFANESERCDALKLQKNSGKAEAVRQGLLAAIEKGSEFIGYWDADLATPLDEVPQMLQIFDKVPAGENIRVQGVIGARVCMLGRHIDRKPIRHYVGRLFASIASLAIGHGVYDTQCGAKLFRVTDEIKRALASPFQNRWSFDVELLQRIFKLSENPDCVIEHPLQRWEDVGDSTVSLFAGIRAFTSLLKIWRLKNRKIE